MNERLHKHARNALAREEGWYQEWYIPRVLTLPKQRRHKRRKYRNQHRSK